MAAAAGDGLAGPSWEIGRRSLMACLSLSVCVCVCVVLRLLTHLPMKQHLLQAAGLTAPPHLGLPRRLGRPSKRHELGGRGSGGSGRGAPAAAFQCWWHVHAGLRPVVCHPFHPLLLLLLLPQLIVIR
jgi:hypothetical protein